MLSIKSSFIVIIADNAAYVVTTGDIGAVVNIRNRTGIYTCNTTNAVGSNIAIAVFTMNYAGIISIGNSTIIIVIITINTSNTT